MKHWTVYIPQCLKIKSGYISYILAHRAVNSPALFIPRGFGESGNAIFSFLGEWGIESHSSGNRVGESGNWGIKIFKLIHYKHNFKLDFLVLCMEWEYTSLKNQPKLDEYKKNLHFSDFHLIFFIFFFGFCSFFLKLSNFFVKFSNVRGIGEWWAGNRGIGESQNSFPGESGSENVSGNPGNGFPGFPVTALLPPINLLLRANWKSRTQW